MPPPDENEIRARLDHHGLPDKAAEHIIFDGPSRVASIVSEPQRLRMAMDNFYKYGSSRWTWIPVCNPSSKLGLLNGTVTHTNCEGFSIAFQFLARDILGIVDLKHAALPVVNQWSKNTDDMAFLTVQGTVAVDRDWFGSVRTFNKSFEDLRMYFFQMHHLCKYQGKFYDPTTNKWGLEPNLIACWIERMREPKGVWKLPAGNPTGYSYLLPLGSHGTGKGGTDFDKQMNPERARWSTWLLSDKDRLEASDLARFSVGGASRR